MAGARHRSSFKVRTILGVAILAQAICVQTPPLLARLVRSFLEGDFVCWQYFAPVSRVIIHHGHKGWSVMEFPSDGWMKVLRGRHPPLVQWPPAQKSSSWWMEEERRVGLQRPRTGCALSKQLSKFWANVLKRRRRSPVHNSEFPRHQIPSSQLHARKLPSWRKLWRFSKAVLEQRWMQSALDRGRVAAQEKSLTEQIRRTGPKNGWSSWKPKEMQKTHCWRKGEHVLPTTSRIDCRIRSGSGSCPTQGRVGRNTCDAIRSAGEETPIARGCVEEQTTGDGRDAII